MRRYVVNAMALAAGISIAFAVVTALFCRQILVLIRTPENILDGAYRYLIIIFIGIPFTVLYNLSAGICVRSETARVRFCFLPYRLSSISLAIWCAFWSLGWA